MNNITDFFSNYKNHPVLFIGTGISLRYLSNSYTWDDLLKFITNELYDNTDNYLDLKSRHEKDGFFRYDLIASDLEEDFNNKLMKERDGKFKEINDIFYENMQSGKNISRLKIYIAKLLEDLTIKFEKSNEISEFKKIRKNIGSIITTNYDKFIETIFEFTPLLGNNILLSNPYGAVYKIHGCVSDPQKIIITAIDYQKFNEKYDLIRAQLLSLFIHNPIIFLGYNIGDENIKSLLKTIFTYVEPNTNEADLIRKNFLLIEYEKDSTNHFIVDHDIEIEGISTIRINKLKTDDYLSVYKSISNLHLPISAMDVRRVQSIVKDIYMGGKISVHITEDLDSIKNEDKIIAIGSAKSISYEYHTSSELIEKYFDIIDEDNSALLSLIDKFKIASNHYYPIYAFSSINNQINSAADLKNQQKRKLTLIKKSISEKNKSDHNSISDILSDNSIAGSYKYSAIIWGMFSKKISLNDIETYLRPYPDKKSTDFKKMLCVYDYFKYK
jgi:hypothetical protein